MMGWLSLMIYLLGGSPVEIEVATALETRGRWREYACLAEIIEAESTWRPDAIGDVEIGGSYGLVQRHAPAHGKPPWPWPVDDQVAWAIEYADARYGGLCEAAEARREQGWW